MFTGEVLMGEAQTKIDVVYDTGSDWLVVPDSDCLSCTGTKHDSSGATSVDPQSDIRAYGSAKLEGKTYSDSVCLTPATCVEMEYFSFHHQIGINDPIEGILGLC